MAIWGAIIVGAVGTAVANFFQSRTWNHQQEVIKKEQELKNATALFDNLSTDMDFRLYSMRQICWAIVSGEMTEPEIDARWTAYRQILYNWNKSLNKNFSMVDRYFGKHMRKLFEDKDGIQERFSKLHNILYRLYFDKADRPKFRRESFDRPADELAKLIRKVNVGMIRDIQLSQVGIFHPDVGGTFEPNLPAPDVSMGTFINEK
ncbi:MAG: hypothetical protein GY940_17195 [bacterium]|nr:hypothetical protein [bacterium]